MKSWWINGILGLWLVILAYLGLPPSAENIILIISGLIIAFFSFRQIIRYKIMRNIRMEDQSKASDSNIDAKTETNNKI